MKRGALWGVLHLPRRQIGSENKDGIEKRVGSNFWGEISRTCRGGAALSKKRKRKKN